MGSSTHLLTKSARGCLNSMQEPRGASHCLRPPRAALGGQSIDTATLIEASTADFSMYPTAFGLAATAFFTASESRSCFGGMPRLVNRICDQIAIICALSRPVSFL